MLVDNRQEIQREPYEYITNEPPYEPTNLQPIYHYNCFEIRATVSLPL
jgi:hypothetical protein